MEVQALDQENHETHSESWNQFSTFVVGSHLYGIDVTKVQEVVMPLRMTKVPLAPHFVQGLINLRGQVATAIDLRKLFNLDVNDRNKCMNVVCDHETGLLTFQVDQIGDVLQVPKSDLESTPTNINSHVRQFLVGVYKVNQKLLSIIDIELIVKFVNSKIH